jgi:hypothetical protein
MYQFIVLMKAINEIALLALMGQGVLYLFCGARRDSNAIYFVFKTITAPVMRFTRIITPRFVLDQHIGWVALFLLLLTEIVLIAAKIHLYLEGSATVP